MSARFHDWITRQIDRFEFRPNQDFILVTQNGVTKEGRGGDRRSNEYWLTLDMAKELAMLARTAKGREARRYFIDCERQVQEQLIAKLQAAQQQQALPAPDGPRPLAEEILKAVDRKAQQVSLHAYESAKDQLALEVAAWMEQGHSERAIIEQVTMLIQPGGKRQLISADSLRDVTSMAAAMRATFDHLMNAIHTLERETGREWYGRPLPDHR